MAEVVVDSRDVVAPLRTRRNFIAVAAVSGVAWWAFASILTRYVIEPIACRSSATLAACGDASSIAGVIAVLIVAAGSLYALVLLRQPRPLIIVAGASVILWGLGLYLTGLTWYESLLWSIVLYCLSYALMAMIARVRGVWMSLIVAVLGVVLVRLFVAF